MTPVRQIVNPKKDRMKFVSSESENENSIIKNGEYYQQIIHISIIDFLQDWSLSKRMERRLKGNSTEISAVPPNIYQERFYKFMFNNILRPAYQEK